MRIIELAKSWALNSFVCCQNWNVLRRKRRKERMAWNISMKEDKLISGRMCVNSDSLSDLPKMMWKMLETKGALRRGRY